MNKIFTLLVSLLCSSLFAQETTSQFDLQQCIKYGIDNHEKIKNGQLDLEISKTDIKKMFGSGLPQLSAEGEFNYFYQLPTTLIPKNAFNPNASPNEFDELQFGTKFNTKGGLTLSQLIFNGSYFVGLKAAKSYNELMESSLDKNKLDVVETITKAYYNVLITNERIKTLDANIALLDTLYSQMKEMYGVGFVEKLDVDKAELNLNNIRDEKENFQMLQSFSYQLLKFQMGMPIGENLEVLDNITAYEIPVDDESEQYVLENRVEYSMLSKQKELYLLEKQNGNVKYLPSIVAFANHSYNNPTNTFSNTFSGDGKWFPTGILGAKLTIPIFSGFQNKYTIEKSNLNIQKTENELLLLRRSIDLQVSQSRTNLTTSISTLGSKKKNIDLAERVYLATVEKYKEGTTGILEVTTAYTDFRNTQTNYYNALYDVIIAKIELDKAKGELKY